MLSASGIASSDRRVETALAGSQRSVAADVLQMLARVAADVLQMRFSAAGFRMRAAIALAPGKRVRAVANTLAAAVHRLLEVVPYLSPSLTAL